MDAPDDILADELQAVRERYGRRERLPSATLYDPMGPYVCPVRQERERAWIRCFRRAGLLPVHDKRVLEVGCGGGGNLIDLVRLGFRPENLVGNDLLDEPLGRARSILPSAVTLLPGDACALELEEGSFHVVLQSTVFSSVLDRGFQERLAQRMWRLVRPGGGVLWYDFTWNNPRNPDVRGIPVAQVRRLFPAGRPWWRRLTLAPPQGRRLCQITPALYPVFNALPPLRTHILCWIEKPLVPPLEGERAPTSAV